MKPEITLRGAQDIAIAFENIRKGFSATSVMQVLAFNLGLKRMHSELDIVSYNPINHEDVAGGLLPGDLVCVLACGWTHEETVVVRARVALPKRGAQ